MLTGLPLLLALSAQAAPIGEVWVALEGPEARREALNLGASFAEGREGQWVRVHGDAGTLDALEARFQTRERRGDHRVAPPAVGGSYHTPEEMAEVLAELAERWPGRAELVQIGESLEDRPILALRLGTADGPSWRILGAHHGDELSSAELALATAQALLADDPRMPAGLLDRAEVWVVPHVNPDGVAQGSRYNARDVDLNRNYGFEWSGSEPRSGGGPFSEPEPRAVRSLSLLEPFHAGLSLHSGAENIGYVWNYTEDDTVEEARLVRLGATYEAACAVEGFYSVNGADWYITRGDTNDWSYGMRGILDYTVEISTTKAPSELDLDVYLKAHLPAVGAFLAAPAGLSGEVLDAETGQPIDALIQVPGAIDAFSNDPSTGRFDRILDPGEYTIVVEAPGYTSAQLTLSAGAGDFAAVRLQPAGLTPLRPEPALLSRGLDSVDLSLPELDPLPDFITLWRSGADPVTVYRQDNSFPVPTADLVPGPYTLLWEGGAAPRSVFAGNPSDRVAIEDAALSDGILTLTGRGFAPGARAWALWGEGRPMRPVAVLSLGEGTLELDASDLPTDELVDLLIASNGAEVVVLDALGDALIDDEVPFDTGFVDEADTGPAGVSDGPIFLRPGGSCGCAGAPGPLSPLAAAMFALLATTFRRSRWRP